MTIFWNSKLRKEMHLPGPLRSGSKHKIKTYKRHHHEQILIY